MNRKGFLKSIVMLAIVPKIISEMEVKPPLINNECKGLIPTLLSKEYHFVEYVPGNFTLNDLNDMIENYDRAYKPSCYFK